MGADLYFDSVIDYRTVDAETLDKALTGAENRPEVDMLIGQLKTKGTQKALAKVIVFPVIMLVCYLVLIFYFKTKGGYRPIVLE